MDTGSLEAVIEKYQNELKRVSTILATGKYYPFYIDTFHNKWITAEALFKVRTQGVFELFYDTFQHLKKEQPALLSTITEKVRDPVLDEIVEVEEKFPPPEQTKEHFVAHCSEPYLAQSVGKGNWNMTLIHPLRALLFLELLRLHPEKAEELTTNSTYFPHRLFTPFSAKTKREVTLEIEREIATVLPTLYSERLLQVLPHIDDFVERKNGVGDKLGPYILCEGFKFKRGITAEGFEEIFGDPELKKEVYYTLAESLSLASATARQYERGAKSLRHFSLASMHYAIAKNALDAYAFNQMLSVFQKTGGKFSTETFLTRYAQLRAKIEGKTLIITDNYHHSTERLTLQTSYKNSSRDLPLCIALLHRLYQTAAMINARK